MPISTLARRFSPELRASVYYFINFTSAGAAVAYAGIWFAGEGLSSGEIGVINAVPVFIMLGLNLLVGRIADRAKDWRQVIIAGALASAFLPLGLFFAHGFWAILLVWTAIAVRWRPSVRWPMPPRCASPSATVPISAPSGPGGRWGSWPSMR